MMTNFTDWVNPVSVDRESKARRTPIAKKRENPRKYTKEHEKKNAHAGKFASCYFVLFRGETARRVVHPGGNPDEIRVVSNLPRCICHRAVDACSGVPGRERRTED
jgi:hypothetical protein